MKPPAGPPATMAWRSPSCGQRESPRARSPRPVRADVVHIHLRLIDGDALGRVLKRSAKHLIRTTSGVSAGGTLCGNAAGQAGFLVRGVAYDLPDRHSLEGRQTGTLSVALTPRDGWDLGLPSSSALCLLQLAPGAWRRSGIARRMRCFLGRQFILIWGDGAVDRENSQRYPFTGRRSPSAPPRGRNVPHNIQLPPDRGYPRPDERDTCSCRTSRLGSNPISQAA